MGKLNLSDAAKAVLLGEGAKDTFDSNIASKRGQSHHTSGHAPHGEVGVDKLGANIVPGTKEVGKIEVRVKTTKDGAPNPTKGVPTATPPGAKPPVGSDPMKKIDQNVSGVKSPQEHEGRKDLVDTPEEDINDEDYTQRAARKPSKLAPQMFQKNPGATFQSYAEETEEEGEVVAEEEEKHEDEAEDKKLIKKMLKKEKMQEKMKEDMDALLGGENLSEEFVNKATTIFEAAVVARAEEVIAEAEEELQEQFQLAVEEVKNELAAKLDDYMNYMAEEWFKENQLAIESGLRNEIVEDFIRGMKGLFEEHYIDIPEEKVNVVEELTGRVEELEEELNSQIQAAVALKKELNESKKLEAIHTACEGLTQTQVEKMKSLAESIEFTTEEEFAGKLETLKESYFKSPVKAADSSALNEGVIVEEDKKEQVPSEDPSINFYAQTISKTLVK